MAWEAFETATVIKGFTKTIDLTCINTIQQHRERQSSCSAPLREAQVLTENHTCLPSRGISMDTELTLTCVDLSFRDVCIRSEALA